MEFTTQGSTKTGQGGDAYGEIADANVISASRRFTELQQRAAYLDVIPLPVMVMDPEHTILYFNMEAARVVGRSVESSLGLKSWDLIDSPACRAGTCSGMRAMREKQTVAIETTAIAQGKTIHVRAISTPVYSANREVIGFLVVLEDMAGKVYQVSKGISHLFTASRGGGPSERGKILQFQRLRRGGNLELFHNLMKRGTMRLRQAVAILILLADAIELNYTLRKSMPPTTIPSDDAHPGGQEDPRCTRPN